MAKLIETRQLNQILLDYMKHHEIRVTDVARKLNMPVSSCYYYLKERGLQIENFLEICDAIGLNNVSINIEGIPKLEENI